MDYLEQAGWEGASPTRRAYLVLLVNVKIVVFSFVIGFVGPGLVAAVLRITDSFASEGTR